MPKKVIKTSYLDQVEAEVEANQSKLSLVLGALIILVVGVLVFNYFNKSSSEIGPSQTTETTEDVAIENLPGKYTVKANDTLFLIAQKYYQDGYKYTEIALANNLTDVNSIETGQVLEIPKLEVPVATTEPTITPEVSPPPAPIVTTQTDTTNWGPVIVSNTYTVVEGDWLSVIAARAYNGDIMAYTKLAEANKITNPDYIQPGMVLTIPR